MIKFRRMLAVSLPALLLAGVMSFTAFADGEDDEFEDFTISLKADMEEAAPGDIIDVRMVLDTREKLGGMTIALVYDRAYFEYQAGTAKKGISAEADINDTNIPGKIKFACITQEGITSSVLMTASFKVLKVNGTLALDCESVMKNDQDGTKVTKHCKCENVKIACAHANVKYVDMGECHSKVCTDCNETLDAEEDHAYGDWEVATLATASKTGSETRSCMVCGHREEREIPKHVPTAVDGKAPSCTKDGCVFHYHCGVCGKDFEDRECTKEIDVFLPAAGHQYGEWKVVKEPTETEPGAEERICGACGEKEIRTIPASGEEEYSKSPLTGDRGSIMFWSVAAALAMGGAVYTVKRKGVR